MRLTLADVVRLVEVSEEAMRRISYARRNGGKYRSVERMFEGMADYDALRSELFPVSSAAAREEGEAR